MSLTLSHTFTAKDLTGKEYTIQEWARVVDSRTLLDYTTADRQDVHRVAKGHYQVITFTARIDLFSDDPDAP
jgi:hypothetical protein